MCGIVAYTGKQNALSILLHGLRSLEYRGYDSAGVALITSSGVRSEKKIGQVINLENALRDREEFSGTTGIAHTRWATHGGVTEANAHPHHDCSSLIWLAHNGIIENYKELKENLLQHGHRFISETDTEVVAHVIEEVKKENPGRTLGETVQRALRSLQGTFGLVVIDATEPETLVAVRNFSPLVLGVAEDGYIVASDPSAVLAHTREVIYLNDGEMAMLTPVRHHITNFQNQTITRDPETIEWTIEAAQKGDHPHFMHKEIFEQPEALENSTRGRLFPERGLAKLGGLEEAEETLHKTKRLMITACGTSYFAGCVGRYMLEEYAGITTNVELASELRYRKPLFKEHDALLAISQSGETADTLAALREAKEKGVFSLGIVNAVGSTIARETDAGVYQHAGPEIGVASTKAFTSQVTILALFTLFFGREREMSLTMGKRIAEEIRKLPALLRETLKESDRVKEVAEKYGRYNNFLYLGRKYNFPVALEGALKIKEIAYVHAEGLSAGEMKHGPIAMIDKNFPSIFIAPSDSVYEKTLSNMEEVKARGGPIIAIATKGNTEIEHIADDVIYIPKTLEMLTPILSVIPLQLFAYYIGVGRGYNVDKPRNLAKSVTVE